MKHSDPLELVEPCTLIRPGPIGRLVGLGLGTACLYALYQIIFYRESILATPVSMLPTAVIRRMVSRMAAAGICGHFIKLLPASARRGY